MQEARTQKTGVNSRVLFIFDDMAASRDMIYSNIISEIAFDGRHLELDCLYLTQYFKRANTAMRSNADVLMLETLTNMNTLKDIYLEFGSIDFASFEDFVGVVLNVTKNYGTFVISNEDPNARGKERFFQYHPKAPEEIPPFRMLCAAAWDATNATVTEKYHDQKKKFKPKKKYSESYMKKLKEAEETELLRADVDGSSQLVRRQYEPMWQHVLKR